MIRPVAADGRVETGGVFTPIRRPRILERIAAAAVQRVVLIVAPAGYGKSVALRQYLDTLETPHVRYDVGSENGALLGFARGLADAFLEIAPDARKTLSGAYEKTLASNRQGVDLAAWMHAHIKMYSGTIAVDDLHVGEPDPQITKFLVSLIERTKGRARWILASRSSLDLPVGSWLAYGEMDLPIDESDLRFNVEEARETARGARVGVRDEELAEILKMTEGWPTALSFALRTSTRSVDLLNISSMTREMIYRYLAEQVYEALTAEERDVLHFAAYLPVIDAETLKHGGIANGKAVLEALRARVAFIYHERPGVYYCHDLFRDFLNHQLEMQGDDAVAGMLARAGAALEAVGRTASALTAYAKADAASDILRLLEREGFDLVDRAHGDAVQAAVAVLGESVRATSPVVLGMRAMNEAALGRFDRAESLFERALAKASDRELSARLAIPLAMLRFNQGRSASALLESLADDEEMPVGLRAEMYSVLACDDAYLGPKERAAEQIRRAESCIDLVDDDATRAKVYQRLGVAHMYLGDIAEARERLTAAADLAVASGLPSLAARAYNALANVTMVHEEASPAIVVWYAQQAVGAATKAGDRLALQTALIQMLDIEECRGSIDRMRSILGQLAEATTSDRVRGAIIVEGNSWLAAAEGRFDEAYRLLAPVAERDTYEEDRILNGTLVALYAVTLGKRGEGLERVQRALKQIAAFVPASSRAALMVEIARALGALVEALAGRGGAAGRTLAREGPEAPPAARMLRRAVLCLVRALKTPAAGAELTEALEALRSAGYGGYARLLDLVYARYLAASQPEASVLTRAELAMLQGLAAGKSPKEIAVENGRSVYTVQTHIRNAIAKLGCSGRDEALVFARHCGLIA